MLNNNDLDKATQRKCEELVDLIQRFESKYETNEEQVRAKLDMGDTETYEICQYLLSCKLLRWLRKEK